jgi:hypothetical protein
LGRGSLCIHLGVLPCVEYLVLAVGVRQDVEYDAERVGIFEVELIACVVVVETTAEAIGGVWSEFEFVLSLLCRGRQRMANADNRDNCHRPKGTRQGICVLHLYFSEGAARI